MARFKAKAYNAENQEIDVELDDQHVVTREMHDTLVQGTVVQRLKRQKQGLRAELLKDDEFKAEFLKHHNIDPAAKGGKGSSAEDIERMQGEWRRKEVDPLTEKLSASEKRALRLIEKRREAELTTALVEAGVKKGVASRFAKLHAGDFGYDDETDSFGLKNGEDFVVSTKATKEQPYKGFGAFAEEFVADKGNGDFVEKQTQSGPGLGNTPGNRGGVITISRADASDAQKYEAAQAQATAIGGTVQVAN